jgi:diguanylate cyclase (GGDEF)-like protein
MVQEAKMSAVLSEFARTLATDFPIQAILDHLVHRIVEVLPVTAAGVTLISEGEAPQYIAASDASALRFERLQTKIGEGPCLLAYETGEAVSIPDLGADDHFPTFSVEGVKAGLAAVFTFPLRDGEGGMGALDLYRDTAGALSKKNMEAAQTLADVATAYLLNAQARMEARSTSDTFEYGTLHDPLTGLANRRLLQERLEQAGRRARRSRSSAAIIFIDLDRFKQVNDNHGHLVGDQLLIAVARRLSSLIRPGDTLSRFSGDEFVLLCVDMHAPADVDVLVHRINHGFDEPFVLGGLLLSLKASIGVAFAGPGQQVSDRLLASADMAMYQAKREGGARHQTVDLREAHAVYEHDLMERALTTAFGQDELDVAYQPIVSGLDGHVTSVEALLRWTRPKFGPVPPSSIIALAEETNLISGIGAWVLERACRDRGRWLADHHEMPIDVTVNVSARQLADPDFCSTVSRVLADTGMDPSALVLEVTESIFIEDDERTAELLDTLRTMGIRLALDDFGTGYSSLSYLRRLPIDIVKIDQSFIADINRRSNGGTGNGAAVVAAVTHLAHAFGLTVVAEGVETQRQHDAVRAVGCEAAQGYFYARPMPASEIGAYLVTRHVQVAALTAH